MKKAFLIFVLLFFPFSIYAQSMIKTPDSNVNQEIENGLINSNVNLSTDQEDNQEREKTVISITVDLPDLKFLPSNPFYFIKEWWEGIRGWFIFNTTKKAEYGINLADKRLEEIESLAQKKKTDLINETTSRFNEQMKKVNQQIDKAKKKGKNLDSIYNLLETNKEKHQAVFDKLLKQIPEEAKEIVNKAKEISQEEFGISQEKIKEKAIEGGLKGIEKVKEGLDVLENKLQESSDE